MVNQYANSKTDYYYSNLVYHLKKNGENLGQVLSTTSVLFPQEDIVQTQEN